MIIAYSAPADWPYVSSVLIKHVTDPVIGTFVCLRTGHCFLKVKNVWPTLTPICERLNKCVLVSVSSNKSSLVLQC